MDCDGCFDEATLTIDPAIAGSGWLAITHVLAGTCIDDYEETEMFISVTPSPQLTASTESLCDDDFFDFNATPPFGTWSASCGGCIIPNTGVFFADQADEGLNTVTFTTLGVCPGDTSIEVGVSEEQAGVISGPSLLCEDDTVVFEANFPRVLVVGLLRLHRLIDRGVQPIRPRSEHLDHLVHAGFVLPCGRRNSSGSQ